jgi:hypothetical protein
MFRPEHIVLFIFLVVHHNHLISLVVIPPSFLVPVVSIFVHNDRHVTNTPHTHTHTTWFTTQIGKTTEDTGSIVVVPLSSVVLCVYIVL